jgi:hypothetical protein
MKNIAKFILLLLGAVTYNKEELQEAGVQL